MSSDINTFFEEVKRSHAQFGEQWAKLQDFHSRKLWHQLSLVLKELVIALTTTAKQGDATCKKLYTCFIKTFEDKLNQLTLVEMLLLLSDKLANAQEAMAFLESISLKVESNKAAFILTRMKLADIYLASKDSVKCKEIMEKMYELIEGSQKSLREEYPISIHAAYYIVSAELYKTQGKFTEFYCDALKYLACVELEKLDPSIRVQRAFDLGLAALLSSDIYNFGELVVHPILNSLKGTEHAWLNEFLCAFNSGDISTFNRLKAKWSTQSDLKANQASLEEKIRLLALLELVFSRPADDRHLSFDSIAKHVHVTENEVEMLVMKALSLNLIKGVINQVERDVLVKWVRPKVLDLKQISFIKGKLQEWCGKVDKTEMFIQDQTPQFAS